MTEAPFAFEDPDEQEAVWGRRWGCRDEIGQLRSAVLPAGAGAELDEVLAAENVDVFLLPSPGMQPRDLLTAALGGVVLLRPAAPAVRAQSGAAMRIVAQAGCPILRTISGTGLLEGGNLVWLTPTLLGLGLTRDGNETAAHQLEQLLAPGGIELLRIPLPGLAERLEDVLAPVDADLVLLHGGLLPWSALARMRAAGLRCLDLPLQEKGRLGDILVLRPGRVLIEAESAPRLADRLDLEGIDVVPISVNALANGISLRRRVAPLERQSQ